MKMQYMQENKKTRLIGFTLALLLGTALEAKSLMQNYSLNHEEDDITQLSVRKKRNSSDELEGLNLIGPKNFQLSEDQIYKDLQSQPAGSVGTLIKDKSEGTDFETALSTANIFAKDEKEALFIEVRKTRVLSLDGGGIRGLMTLYFLKEIEERTGRKIHELFDVFVGTSTGALIAAGLAKNDPLSIDEMIDLYSHQAHRVFSRSWKHTLKTCFGLFGPKYEATCYEDLLREKLGNIKLSEMKKPFAALSIDVENNGLYTFSSIDAQASKDFDFKVWEIIRSSSAAQTYFAPATLSTPLERDDSNEEPAHTFTLIDGGSDANNPSFEAYKEAKKLGCKKKDIFLLSLGTGGESEGISGYRAQHLTSLGWILPTINLGITGTVKRPDNILHDKLGDAYLRFNVSSGSYSSKLDDYSEGNVKLLKQAAEEEIRGASAKKVDRLISILSN